jgi:LDH2 family malate/lactate/ureidoglycolate dehydrogenase
MSTVAARKIGAAKFAGKAIPDTWYVDDEGLPTTDPSIFPEHGALLPMAGHKGYGLALLIEVLSSVLSGAGITKEVKSWVLENPANPTGQGHAFLAIDIDSIMPLNTFQERMDQMIRKIRNAPRAKGADRIYLPGEMEWQRYEEQKKRGLSLPAEVIESLNGLADDLKLERLF